MVISLIVLVALDEKVTGVCQLLKIRRYQPTSDGVREIIEEQF